jgi:hypothetical protein
VLESLVLGKMLEHFFRVVLLDREGARHRRDRTQAATRRKRPRKVHRKGWASCPFH